GAARGPRRAYAAGGAAEAVPLARVNPVRPGAALVPERLCPDAGGKSLPSYRGEPIIGLSSIPPSARKDRPCPPFSPVPQGVTGNLPPPPGLSRRPGQLPARSVAPPPW